VVSAIAWVIADITSGHIYSNNAFYLWNTIIRLGFFIIVTFLLSKLKKVLKSERELAHIDYVTGAINARYFYDLAKMEITRTNRYHHPLTLVYIDLDNFKMVNDQFGHHIGNQVLLAVTNNLRQHLRYNDIVARLGGDEFALLLPETDQEAAQDVNSKVQFNLNEEMRKNGWPVTFSIGVITYDKVQCSVDEMIKMADNLMYSVKANGKNGVSYSTCKDFVRISIERPY
jgi:diguanylate cyclase (GGDEF)-like protein